MMDEYIKQSIEARKNAFSASFEIDTKMQKKIDALFAEIEKLGKKCKDVGEFEAEFSKSPLNQQYMDLFTEIATNSSAKMAAKSVAGGVVAGVAESVAERAIGSVVPTRAAVHQKVYDEAMKTPVLGDAIDIGQKASYVAHLGKLFKKKKEK